MMGHCPTCGKLVPIEPAPRDLFGRPRKRVVEHEPENAPLAGRCSGSRAFV